MSFIWSDQWTMRQFFFKGSNALLSLRILNVILMRNRYHFFPVSFKCLFMPDVSKENSPLRL